MLRFNDRKEYNQFFHDKVTDTRSLKGNICIQHTISTARLQSVVTHLFKDYTRPY